MAKRLKVKLEDGNVYTFATLTLKETIALRKDIKKRDKDSRKADKLENKQVNGEDLSDEEQDFLDKVEEQEMAFSLKVCRYSLCKNHDEFKVTGKDDEEKRNKAADINDKISELISMDVLRVVVGFAMTGTTPAEENRTEFEYVEEIDLTAEKKK